MTEKKIMLKKIAISLGELAEDLLRRDDKYRNIPVHEEAASYMYLKYLQFYDEIDSDFREKILTRMIDFAKFQFLDTLVGVDESFAKSYPEHMETKNQFGQWLSKKESHDNCFNHNTKPSQQGKIQFNKIINKIIMERNPTFEADKHSFPKMIAFSKNWATDNKLFILIDKGTKRQFLDFFIGLENPKLCFDIALFHGGVQSKYKYNSSSDLEYSIDKALDYVNALLQAIEDRLIGLFV